MNKIIEAIKEGMKHPEIKICAINFFNNKNFEGIEVTWSGNIGFGSMTLHIDKKTNKLVLDTECMGGKEFAKRILNKIIDSCEEVY